MKRVWIIVIIVGLLSVNLWAQEEHYSVTVTTLTRPFGDGSYRNNPTYFVGTFNCGGEEELCEDLASALNEGRADRILKQSSTEPDSHVTPDDQDVHVSSIPDNCSDNPDGSGCNGK